MLCEPMGDIVAEEEIINIGEDVGWVDQDAAMEAATSIRKSPFRLILAHCYREDLVVEPLA